MNEKKHQTKYVRGKLIDQDQGRATKYSGLKDISKYFTVSATKGSTPPQITHITQFLPVVKWLYDKYSGTDIKAAEHQFRSGTRGK